MPIINQPPEKEQIEYASINLERYLNNMDNSYWLTLAATQAQLATAMALTRIADSLDGIMVPREGDK